MTDWHRPANAPTLPQLQEMNAKLAAIIESRGHQVSADPALAMYRVVAVERLLLEAGIVSEEQLAYYEAHAEFLELSRLEHATRPKPRIFVPGRDASLS